MPTSLSENIHNVINIVMSLRPNKILELGCGLGKYGVLLREYYDVNIKHNIPKHKWTTTIDTIEIFPDYICPIHYYVYNKIIIGNFLTQIKNVDDDYDVALCVDVIEHLEFNRALEFIKEVKTHCKNIVMVVPDFNLVQGAAYHNEHETHLSVWDTEEKVKMLNPIKYARINKSWIILI